MTERWLPVVGFEGYYEVSDQGRVRSLDRVVFRLGGEMKLRGRVLSPSTGTGGHLSVALSLSGQVTSRKVHRLVAEAFINNLGEFPCVLHWDDNPANNRVENLRWGDFSDNMADRVRNGLHHNANKTHCKRGHEFNPENTVHRKDRPRSRTCRECSREATKERMRIIRGTEPPNHGTLSGYTYYGCRCGPCRSVALEYERKNTERKRGNT